jgi:hypothetical protein
MRELGLHAIKYIRQLENKFHGGILGQRIVKETHYYFSMYM